jgi:hypothetical protein
MRPAAGCDLVQSHECQANCFLLGGVNNTAAQHLLLMMDDAASMKPPVLCCEVVSTFLPIKAIDRPFQNTTCQSKPSADVKHCGVQYAYERRMVTAVQSLHCDVVYTECSVGH